MSTSQIQVQVYKDIMNMFQLIENVMKAIELPEITDRRRKFEMAEPFILAAGEELENVLTAYTNHIQNGGISTQEDVKIIQDGMRRILTELAKIVYKLYPSESAA